MIRRMHYFLHALEGNRQSKMHIEAESAIRGKAQGHKSADRQRNVTSEGRWNNDEAGPLILEGRHQRKCLQGRQATVFKESMQP